MNNETNYNENEMDVWFDFNYLVKTTHILMQ